MLWILVYFNIYFFSIKIYIYMYRFFKHPNQVCMSYKEHMLLSLGFSKDFFVGGVKAVVHAFYPDVYITSTTDTLNEIQQKIKIKGCHK